MSNISEVDIDLEKLFLPAWAQEAPTANRYAKFAGEPAGRDDRPREGRRGGPRSESFGERRGPRPARSGPKFGDRKPGFSRGDDRGERRERPEPTAPLPDITVTFLPDTNGVESLARQIRVTGRAYPLFDIARLILQKPERYAVQLTVKKKADGTAVQPLFLCALDDTPWLSEDEAVAHVMKNHFATFYQAERTATEPPKGTYTFVAQCGMSGAILGPPNHHDYQNQLRKLHAERFARMPFDAFKARVKIVRDEAVVKKWIEGQSFKTEYTCLNVPEALKLASLEEVEKHFRTVHKETIVKPVETLAVGGVLSRALRNRGLQQLIRSEWEEQKRFPLHLATGLSKQFATLGLQFFKVNKTVTHVSVARPTFLDLETTPVSENIKSIIGHINAHPKCTRRQLVEALAPTPKPTVIEIKPAPAVAAPTPEVVPAEGGTPGVAATDTAAPKAETPKAAAPATEPTPEQTAVIADLHWLVHQGHVIEFADGRMDTAKKPLPRPPKPEKKPVEEKPVAEGEVAATVTAPVGGPAGDLPASTEAGSAAVPEETAVDLSTDSPAPAEPMTEEKPLPEQ